MIKQTIEKALNSQINAEFYSSYLYLAMSSHCEVKGLSGLSNWLNVQAQEELTHALKLYHYVLERGGKPEFLKIEGAPNEWETLSQLFGEVVNHEQMITKRINDIASLALKEDDHALYHFIQWYINEQVEEEATAEQVLMQVKMAEENNSTLFMLDKELGSRVFVDSTGAQA